jgi:hypothetical protein
MKVQPPALILFFVNPLVFFVSSWLNSLCLLRCDRAQLVALLIFGPFVGQTKNVYLA